MKVHLIKKKTILDFTLNHSNSKKDFEQWLSILNAANWNKPQDIACLFPTSDLLGSGINRVVFNVGGNKYRLICSYYFGQRMVRLYIKWIGTHRDYTTLCKDGKQYYI
jgi:mRNA interferase HigB